MTRVAFISAFILGAIAVAAMGWVFAGSDALAFAVTGVIGFVYVIGLVELLQFRRATLTLSLALRAIPRNMTSLSDWLNRLDPSLQNAVRLRIEGERVGLPAPVVTPYLVGLLVMLGLLGTFLGMVDTLKGAVVAIEGSNDLEAIRAGLVAPMTGLGFAFGTSVAGVAASAMLGLMSTVSRRDRMLATRDLDTKIATDLRNFSHFHRQASTHKALQIQADAMPELLQSLQLMTGKFEQMMQGIGDTLITNQERFHASTKQSYNELASAVDQSLRQTIAESGRLAGEGIQPIVKEVMTGLRSETQHTHLALTEALQKQFETLAGSFAKSSQEIANTWEAGLTKQAYSNENMIDGLTRSQSAFTTQFDELSASLLASFDNMTAELSEQQMSGDQERLNQWLAAFTQARTQTTSALESAAEVLTNEMSDVSQAQQAAFTGVTQEFHSMVSQVAGQLEQATATTLSHQQLTSELLEKSVAELADHSKVSTEKLLSDMKLLIQSNESLLDARVQSEAAWMDEHKARMDQLTKTLQAQLETLRADEAERGSAAVARLGDLEIALVKHLSSLGQALEEPMTRLIQTASETPRAAAEVIEHLRGEISKNIERDNAQLEERCNLMAQLSTLSNSLGASASEQRDAVENLIQSSTVMLKEVGTQFSQHVSAEISKLANASDHFAATTVEMASLGEGFKLAVQLFQDSNEKLVENLNRIEASLSQSTERSDEQLGYYIAQAREIIDYSIHSQKELIDELRQIRPIDSPVAAEVS